MDDLLAPFHDAEKPRSRFRIGTEAEKFGVYEDGKPVPFSGPRGIRAVLSELAERHAWFESAEYEGGEVIKLVRGEASITLEPGGQLELSGAPHEAIHFTCAEFRGHMAELRDISEAMGITWLGLGFHPFASQADLPWVPKLRYAVMREYLPTRGSMALDMMRRTCTVQANMDYSDEADAIRKLRFSLRIQPIVTAMFANSPWVEGQPSGERSHRGTVWLNMDPDRSGLLPFAWEDDMTYRRYVEWALDVPMFLIKRDGEIVKNTGQTFRSFLKDGYQGHRPTREDWETHLNTLFPEVRLKKTLEVRGADSQDTELVCALPALWKGLLYDDRALARAEKIAEPLRHDEVEAARPEIARKALRAKLAGRDVAEWANELLDCAWEGLAHLSHLNRTGEDETVHLVRLKDLVRAGKSPADVLLERVDQGECLRTQVLKLARIRTENGSLQHEP
jgi:glutamate--cysteine ligase